jgi:hypothetical protein
LKGMRDIRDHINHFEKHLGLKLLVGLALNEIHISLEIVKQRTEIAEIGMVFASFADTEGNIVNIVGDM